MRYGIPVISQNGNQNTTQKLKITRYLSILQKMTNTRRLESIAKSIATRHKRKKYGDARLSLQKVYEWSRKFLNGVSPVTDSPRPGQAHRVVTPEAIAAVEAIVKEKLLRNSAWNSRISGYESRISTPYRP